MYDFQSSGKVGRVGRRKERKTYVSPMQVGEKAQEKHRKSGLNGKPRLALGTKSQYISYYNDHKQMKFSGYRRIVRLGLKIYSISLLFSNSPKYENIEKLIVCGGKT